MEVRQSLVDDVRLPLGPDILVELLCPLECFQAQPLQLTAIAFVVRTIGILPFFKDLLVQFGSERAISRSSARFDDFVFGSSWDPRFAILDGNFTRFVICSNSVYGRDKDSREDCVHLAKSERTIKIFCNYKCLAQESQMRARAMLIH